MRGLDSFHSEDVLDELDQVSRELAILQIEVTEALLDCDADPEITEMLENSLQIE